MNKRSIHYNLRYAASLILSPYYRTVRRLVFNGDHIQHKGITIVQFDEKKDPLFIEHTKTALDYLEETDPIRFKRVQRFIKAIIYSNRGLASYNKDIVGCFVGFAHFHFEDDDAYKIPWYARTLVHEATHGVFHQHKIPYTKRTRERVEYACVLEEWRFAQRFQDGLNWHEHTWSRITNQAWDNVWRENPIHRAKTIFRPNANGELEPKRKHNRVAPTNR